MRKLEITLFAAIVLLTACREAKPRTQAPEPPAVVFEMRTFEQSRPGCGDHGNHAQACVSFRAAWPEFKGGAGDAAAKMNAAVLTALGFPEGPARMGPFCDEMVERWRVEHRGVVYADSTWFERRIVQVLARRPEVWSFEVERLGQTGKALPFDERSYLNLNPRTGAPVALSSLLERGAGTRLATLAEKQLRAELNLTGEAPLPLKDAVFGLPEQFAVTSAGVVLAWSGDALRKPASAPMEITVPWSDARDLVRAVAVKPPSPDAEQGF
jgi:hypothetical protein